MKSNADGQTLRICSRRRVFVCEQRCHQLEAWAAALGWELLGSFAGRAGVLKARVQPLQGCLMAEELYPARLSVGWRDPCGLASLLLMQHGRCIPETLAVPEDGAQAPLLLQADGRNGALLAPAAS